VPEPSERPSLAAVPSEPEPEPQPEPVPEPPALPEPAAEAPAMPEPAEEASASPEPEAEQVSVPQGDPIDINSANYEQLRSLKLSVTQTGRILSYRERTGGFKSLDELENIPGFPKQFLDDLRGRLTL
jgi:DNA uptake protein ComE-like DNA-binding protein